MPAVDGLADDLRRIGREAGLDAVGLCHAAPFTEAQNALEGGRARGWHGGMQFTYRNPRRSTDPSVTLAGARSMVVGARSYERSPDPAVSHEGAPATVARYAWVDHYAPLRSALGRVADRLRECGWRAAVLADDNALVDRAAAVRSGIGWYGKNTNVIIPGAGSWFVIGSVVTDAQLTGPRSFSEAASEPPGHTRTPGPVPDGCGGCRRCIDACPTGAIVDGGHLDARRCLAWLLQAPGDFPREHRVALGGRIYGCDDCQAVCPINKVATRRHPPPPAEPGARPEVDLLDLLRADDEAILGSVGRWYIPGRDPKYVRRNALVALGNVGDPRSAAVIAAAKRGLVDPDPLLRAHAVWAAARLGRLDLLPLSDPDPTVREELAAAGGVAPRPGPR